MSTSTDKTTLELPGETQEVVVETIGATTGAEVALGEDREEREGAWQHHNPTSLRQTTSEQEQPGSDQPSEAVTAGGSSGEVKLLISGERGSIADQITDEMLCEEDVMRYRRISKELKKLQFFNPGPQMRVPSSERTRRARSRHQHQQQLDLEEALSDLCDCLNPGCPGCFLPCPRCSSNKCGVHCRDGRTWSYTKIVSRVTKETLPR